MYICQHVQKIISQIKTSQMICNGPSSSNILLYFCVDSKVSSGSMSGCKINAELLCLWVFRSLSIKQTFLTSFYRSASEYSQGRLHHSVVVTHLFSEPPEPWPLYHLLGDEKEEEEVEKYTFYCFENVCVYVYVFLHDSSPSSSHPCYLIEVKKRRE